MVLNNKGYTLVELLVVITIMSLLMGAVFANYIKQQQNETLKSAAQEVVATIELARQQSLTNEIPDACTPNTSFLGSGIATAGDGKSIDIDYYCPTNFTIKSVLVSKYKYITLTPSISFYFKGLKGETSDSASHTICVSHDSLSTKYKITISSLGKIDMYGNQASCP